jgi:hypothetical protein
VRVLGGVELHCSNELPFIKRMCQAKRDASVRFSAKT